MLGLLAGLVTLAPAAAAHAQDDSGSTAAQGAPTTTTDVAVPSAPLLAVPPGCAVPPAPATVFVGTVIARDASTARFHVDQVRAGSTARWEVSSQIDVRYGNEARFLGVNEQYLVGAAPDATTALLSSKVAERTPLFGGSSVIGLNESGTDCPLVEDGVRTLHVDGTSIDSGVFSSLRNSKGELVDAVLRPVAWAFLILLTLVAMKHLLFGFVRGMRGAPAVASGPRARRHGPGDLDGGGDAR